MVSIDRKKLQEACTPSQFKALWTLAMVRNVDRNNTSQRCAIAPHCFKCLPARWGGGGGNGLLPARNYCTRQPVSAEFSLRGGCQLLPLDVPHSQQQRRQFQFSSKTQKLFHNLCKLAHEQQTKSAGLEISLVLKYETKKGTLERG